MSDLPLPPDLERLQTIRAWIDQQRSRQATIGTFLDVIATAVDDALSAAKPAGPPDGYRIQKTRLPEGKAVLHRGDCWISDGATISRDDALLALADDVTSGNLEMCQACRPEDTLEP
ncbi:hypothetical protein K378_01483 [Streptomyces sp. Amel2xB2]|uniref:DUF6233 domain-containing protein n=1 Tax=Streptomyces sp. Amel2xB2 TaxID=1305829 RepID=UPI000DB9315C|nr:DUF6233 domain-containing protein [Streptomyces sp. Amel2xB2]RAJ70318.1 hypothetical protein K378_01483 [Streptomyces sp. Amel2xB2]